MRSAIAEARSAALSFLRESNQDDEHFLVEFNERPTIVEDFTTDIHRLEDRVVSAQVAGSTALYDAIELALENLAHGSRSRKALVLISDGENNHSRYSASDVIEFAKERGIPIYSVGFALQKQPPSRIFHRNGREVLEHLSDITGGRAFFIDSVRDLEKVCRNVAEELRNQYLMGYKSSNTTADGKWRKIQVKASSLNKVSRLTVRAKTGYYAPRGY